VKFFVIAGEASGDIHGANLIEEILKLEPSTQFEGFGGERLQLAGMKLLRSMDKLNFMGFVEVVRNFNTVRENFRICKKALTENKPDAIILIDYPGFNLRMAKWAKQRGIRVFYYISPQVWAWKENRVKKMKKYIDRLLVILPFEKEFFAKHGMDVDFVGHPLIDEIEARREKSEIEKQNVIALLPGSRKQEILHNLHQMVRVQDEFPNYQFVIGRAPGFDVSFYRETFALRRAIVSSEGTYSLLARSKAALVGSGTATLETALMKVPQVVCYKGNRVSVAIARKLINVPYISLVNLILDRPAVKELIQGELNPKSIVVELKNVLREGEARNQMFRDYEELWRRLGSGGASKKAAKLIVSDLTN
jgi:lipid-A-disaccharide synthase